VKQVCLVVIDADEPILSEAFWTCTCPLHWHLELGTLATSALHNVFLPNVLLLSQHEHSLLPRVLANPLNYHSKYFEQVCIKIYKYNDIILYWAIIAPADAADIISTHESKTGHLFFCPLLQKMLTDFNSILSCRTQQW